MKVKSFTNYSVDGHLPTVQLKQSQNGCGIILTSLSGTCWFNQNGQQSVLSNLSYLSSSYSIKLNAIHWYSTTRMCISYNVWMHATAYISTYDKYVYIWYMKESETKSVSHSVVPNSVTPWAVALQAPLSMEFSRQEYWSGCHSLL